MKLDIESYLNRQRDRIDQALDGLLRPVDEDGDLVEAMRYSLIGGGKRLRPILFLATLETFRKRGSSFMPFACGLECIHTYSLIHDDLPAMDNDDMRRGRPTCHVVHGDALAILAGDGLLTLAFELMAGRRVPAGEAERRLGAIAEVARGAGCHGMVRGQAMDIYYEDREVESPVLRTLHLCKTAALIEASVVSAAILAGAEAGEVRSIRRFGRSLGLTFQIVDDVLDVVGDEDITGKRLRKDESKATYPSMYGVEGARILARKENDAAIAALSRLKRDTGVLSAIANYALHRQS